MKHSVFLLAISFIALGSLSASGEDKGVKLTGTFTSLEYNREGGDLVGQEIRIVRARKGYQGALQIAEGAPSDLMVVDVSFDNNRIRFEIPASYPIYGGGLFEGKIEASEIKGVLRFKGGAENPVKWRRGRGYWDK